MVPAPSSVGVTAHLCETGSQSVTTSALRILPPPNPIRPCRTPEIMADAADVIFVKNNRSFTGNFCVDEDVLNEAGVSNFEKYAVVPGSPLTNDLFGPLVYTRNVPPASFKSKRI